MRPGQHCMFLSRRPATPSCCCRRSLSPPGAGPGSPRSGLSAALGPSPIHRKTSQAHRSAAVPLPPVTSPPATRRSAPRPDRPPGGPGPARSARSGAAVHPSPPACTPPRTAAAPARRSGPGSSTDPRARRPWGPHPAPPPADQLRCGQLAPGPARPLDASASRPPARQGAAATGSPTSGSPGTASLSPGRWPGLDQLAASSRSRFRRPLCSAVSPPPSAHLMTRHTAPRAADQPAIRENCWAEQAF
jgi:hypothetical protein